MIKEYFKNRKRNKILLEFNKLREFYRKVHNLAKENAPKEIIVTQTAIIKNNYDDLVKLYKEHDKLIRTKTGFSYLNPEGSEPVVIYDADFGNLEAEVITLHKPSILSYTEKPGYESREYTAIRGALKFNKVRPYPLKSKAYKKLQFLIDKKLEKEYDKVASKFGDNKFFVKEFIYYNVTEKEESLSNQFNRLEFLSMIPKSNTILMQHKDLINIDMSRIKVDRESIKKFLLGFNQKKYDFIIEG